MVDIKTKEIRRDIKAREPITSKVKVASVREKRMLLNGGGQAITRRGIKSVAFSPSKRTAFNRAKGDGSTGTKSGTFIKTNGNTFKGTKSPTISRIKSNGFRETKSGAFSNSKSNRFRRIKSETFSSAGGRASREAREASGDRGSSSESYYAIDKYSEGVSRTAKESFSSVRRMGDRLPRGRASSTMPQVKDKALILNRSYGAEKSKSVNIGRVNRRLPQGTTNAYLRKNSTQDNRAFIQGKSRVVKKKREKAAAKAAVPKGRTVKRGISGFAASVKKVAQGSKALASILMAGGGIALAIVLVCVMFGAAFNFFGDTSTKSFEPVSAEVNAYTPIITKYAKVHGIAEYVELIKAVMMQESGGRGLDPMQCAESGYNTKYPNVPNGITDPEYSIDIGIKTLAKSLEAAGVENPIDMDRIRLALQGYNYGNGYISWAIKRDGGYTIENAIIFSDEQAEKHGWSGYGDKQYVAHVLRYYPYGHYNYGIGNQAIVNIALDQQGNEGGAKFWSWYGFGGRVEWCACLVSWCADQCGYIDAGIIPKFAGVSTGVNFFKERGQWQRPGYAPAPGDIIFFDWEPDGVCDHVGIVESCDGNTVYTIEGNTSDICARRTYSVNSIWIYGYGVPGY